ncbi:ABC transporter permease subunit [Pseudoduganella sp. DS3]|uniref:ABC transporter permease subunit n=1 Tax=Pseudoduganella guangdongensis TaxID=2692179 RepID=A0A6N9HCR1_9BURK|nr:glycine betaine ABC transporter substrate-binding protein [Pseudoduganella guangdongensis]MYN00813.1 ABC transporter permease subunit [Pseudoduganella guangdongensis]
MAALAVFLASAAHADAVLRVGSKRFTESYILGELLAQTAAPHARVEHKQGLGNTAIVLAALKSGSIDVYPEYTGTISLEILKHARPASIEQMQRELAAQGLGVAVPLGFNNTYALAVRGDGGGPQRLSELAAQRGLRYGLSHEFIGRADGWPGLAQRYGIRSTPRGLDHGIAYEALARKQVDVIDIYATDAKISQYGLRVLGDDQGYFPRYDAVLLYRLDAAQRFPAAWQAIRGLEGRISAPDMIAMNAAAELRRQPFATIAHEWLTRHPPAAIATRPGAAPQPSDSAAHSVTAIPQPTAGIAHPATSAQAAAAPSATSADVASSAGATPRSEAAATQASPSLWQRMFADDFWPLTRQHILLVALSVALASLIAIPLGILAAHRPAWREPVMAVAGILQTIPSLALLAILIPLLGSIGTLPALCALFVYALLPIVRNTCTGLSGIPAGQKQAAQALGLRRAQSLRYVELPLAAPTILAGIKTAAVMSVGTATIAAFIGAGGYGERITTGLALNDNTLMLAGALPAAVLALLTQGLFEWMERGFKASAAARAPARLRA